MKTMPYEPQTLQIYNHGTLFIENPDGKKRPTNQQGASGYRKNTIFW
jgi:hypothetical protein